MVLFPSPSKRRTALTSFSLHAAMSDRESELKKEEEKRINDNLKFNVK